MGGLFIFVPWGRRGQVWFYLNFFFLHLTPKPVEAIIDVPEFTIPVGW